MRAVVSVVVVAVLAVCGAACGGKEIKPSPVGESSASPTGDEASRAVAETQRFIDSLNAAFESGDTAQLRTKYRMCKNCINLADQIDAIYSRGGNVNGGRWSITSSSTRATADGVEVFARVAIAKAEILPSAKASAISDYAAESNVGRDFLLRDAGRSFMVVGLRSAK